MSKLINTYETEENGITYINEEYDNGTKIKIEKVNQENIQGNDDNYLSEAEENLLEIKSNTEYIACLLELNQ